MSVKLTYKFVYLHHGFFFRKLSHIAGKLFEAYNKEICFSNSDRHLLLFDDPVGTQEQEGSDICLHGEPDLERIMRRTDLSPSQLEFIWTSWHDVAGSRLRNLYPDLVDMQNAGARNNGKKLPIIIFPSTFYSSLSVHREHWDL